MLVIRRSLRTDSSLTCRATYKQSSCAAWRKIQSAAFPMLGVWIARWGTVMIRASGPRNLRQISGAANRVRPTLRIRWRKQQPW